MAAYVIVTHPVKDFDAWKIAFDQFEQLRKEAGELTAVVLRHADDANTVSVLNTWTSIDAAKTFITSEEIKKEWGRPVSLHHPHLFLPIQISCMTNHLHG